MNEKITFRSVIKAIEDNRIEILSIAIASVLLWFFAFIPLTSTKRDNQINVVSAVYAWKENDALSERLAEALKSDGIEEVNFTYVDATSVDNVFTVMSTVGYMESDLLIMDTMVFDSVFGGDLYKLSNEDQRVLEETSGVKLKYTEDGNGIYIHVRGDEEYNKTLSGFTSFMLFSGDMEEYDFAIYPVGKEKTAIAIKAAALLIKENSTNQEKD